MDAHSGHLQCPTLCLLTNGKTYCTGVDAVKKQLLFIAGSTPDTRRQVRVPLAAIRDGRLSLRTDLMDAHLYIFHKQTFFKAVQARPSYTSIRQVTTAGHHGPHTTSWAVTVVVS